MFVVYRIFDGQELPKVEIFSRFVQQISSDIEQALASFFFLGRIKLTDKFFETFNRACALSGPYTLTRNVSISSYL